MRRAIYSGFFAGSCVFDGHVAELTRLENFAAFYALHEFGVLFTGHDLHAGMLTHRHFVLFGWLMEATGLDS